MLTLCNDYNGTITHLYRSLAGCLSSLTKSVSAINRANKVIDKRSVCFVYVLVFASCMLLSAPVLCFHGDPARTVLLFDFRARSPPATPPNELGHSRTWTLLFRLWNSECSKCSKCPKCPKCSKPVLAVN